MVECGTTAKYRYGCRCDACGAADREYKRRWRERNYARVLLDNSDCRKYISRLNARGVSNQAIADASGVSHRTVGRIANGETAHVRPDTRDAIMGVTTHESNMAPGWKVRLMAAHMERAGITIDELAPAFDITPSAIGHMLRSRRHQPKTLARIVTVYRHLAASGLVPAYVLDEVDA